MNCQKTFNNILRHLKQNSVPYKVVSECGKTVVIISCKDGKMKLIVETEENHE